MHPQTGILIIKQRDDLLHAMHGEIYGGVEHSEQAIHYEDTAGARKGRCRWWSLLIDGLNDWP